jgi:tetratricopeptide (TPR) repeat protein
VAFRESQVRKAPPRPQPVDDDSERLVQGMTDFRMAETALQRNDNAQAEELAKKAYAAEPTNPDYGALVAWISALSGSTEAIPLAIAKLNVILKEEALCERALLYRGRLYKRAKRTSEALRDFTSVLDINPKHAEAATEARILRMKKK